MPTKPILRQAPYLRRYARALTGSQREGDAFVQTTLEALLDGQRSLDKDVPVRLALFRAFHAIWRKALNGHSIDAPRRRLVADARLQRMTPEHRTALLLMLMEGFSLEETAYVLDLPEAATRARFDAAQRAVEQQLATDVLIIEDEPIIALDLERLVGELGHRVTGVAQTHAEAVALAGKKSPGLVLADVRLADGSSGIEAVAEILKTYDVPVVFITAFPERLLTGNRPEPAFLVTKPFRPEVVKTLIGQALFFHQPKPQLQVV
jgi:CheY-like chemotaxis protein